MTAISISLFEASLQDRQKVSQCAVGAEQYSVSIKSSGQLGHCAKPSLLRFGKFFVFPTMRFLVDLSIPMSKISLFELPKSKIFRIGLGDLPFS